jgi:hypothetical protein
VWAHHGWVSMRACRVRQASGKDENTQGEGGDSVTSGEGQDAQGTRHCEQEWRQVKGRDTASRSGVG